jgi:hypothetical protein
MNDTVTQLKEQFRNPTDIYSLLLLVGSEVIETALAQNAGQIAIPVVLSFGWLAMLSNPYLPSSGTVDYYRSPSRNAW